MHNYHNRFNSFPARNLVQLTIWPSCLKWQRKILICNICNQIRILCKNHQLFYDTWNVLFEEKKLSGCANSLVNHRLRAYYIKPFSSELSRSMNFRCILVYCALWTKYDDKKNIHYVVKMSNLLLFCNILSCRASPRKILMLKEYIVKPRTIATDDFLTKLLCGERLSV